MKVDLASALDARGSEATRSERAGDGGGEFPAVLRSNLDRAERTGGRETGSSGGEAAGSTGSTPNAVDDASRDAREAGREGDGQDRAADDGASRERAAREGDEDPKRDGREAGDEGGSDAQSAAAASESAAVGAASGALAERIRVAAEAELESDGRLSEAEAELDAAGQRGSGGGGAATANEALEDDALFAGELDEQQTASARAALSSAGVEPGAEEALRPDEATTAREAQGAETTTPRDANVGASEVAANAGELENAGAGTAFADGGSEGRESFADAREEPSPREASEQAAFDRAAEGAVSGGVDPNLRQAIANGEEARRAPQDVAISGAAALPNPVAGQAVETTTSTTPGAPTPVAASDAIAVQTEWLATRGGGTARLVLHPPELGEMAIRVTLRGGTVDVVMVAQEAVAQAVAEEQGDRLGQALQARDLRMDQFEVRRGDPESFAESELGRFAESGQDSDGRAEDEPGAQRGGESGEGGERRGLLGRSAGHAPPPRIVSVSPESGVDLRI